MFILCTLVTPNTDVSPDVMFSLVEETAASCRTKSKKQLKEVEDAQLAAHRYVACGNSENLNLLEKWKRKF